MDPTQSSVLHRVLPGLVASPLGASTAIAHEGAVHSAKDEFALRGLVVTATRARAETALPSLPMRIGVGLLRVVLVSVTVARFARGRSAAAVLLLGALALGGAPLTGCKGPSRTPASKPIAVVDSAKVSPPARSKSLPLQLAEARTALAAALESGSLDLVGVHAVRLRNLTRALAASDAKRFGPPADTVSSASEGVQEAARRGDLGAAQARFAVLVSSLHAFDHAPDVAQLEIPAQPMDSRSVSLTGEIIDPQCYFTHDGHGLEHRSCATRCAKGGQDLAFLDVATGDIHPLIAVGHGEDPNRGLIEHIGQAVTIEGVLFSRAHNRYLLIQSVGGASTLAAASGGTH